MLSYLVYLITGHCGIIALRGINLALLALIVRLALRILRDEEVSSHPGRDEDGSTDGQESSELRRMASAVAISFFPPLFFFCGLYYTDVASTYSVLLSYFHMQRSWRKNSLRWKYWPGTVILGIMSLSFRQTNIFWVAVFPAGLSLIHELKANAPNSPTKDDKRLKGLIRVVQDSWDISQLYDSAVEDASLEGSVLRDCSHGSTP